MIRDLSLNNYNISEVAKKLTEIWPISYIRAWKWDELFVVLSEIDKNWELSELNKILSDKKLILSKKEWKWIIIEEYIKKFECEPEPPFGKQCYVLKSTDDVKCSNEHFGFKI